MVILEKISDRRLASALVLGHFGQAFTGSALYRVIPGLQKPLVDLRHAELWADQVFVDHLDPQEAVVSHRVSEVGPRLSQCVKLIDRTPVSVTWWPNEVWSTPSSQPWKPFRTTAQELLALVCHVFF